MRSITRGLDYGWTFTRIGETDNGEWLETSTFPTSVHIELLHLKKIPDPFLGLHEWDVQWIGEADWAFKTTFEATDWELSAPNVDLVFDGLDTFSVVSLNGQKIIETENQFVSYRVSVRNRLIAGANELVISFPSTFLKAWSTKALWDKLLRVLNLFSGKGSREEKRSIPVLEWGSQPSARSQGSIQLRVGLGFAHVLSLPECSD